MSLQLGVIGLGTMGGNLARNAAHNGARVCVYNRTTEKMQKFLKDYGKEGDIVGCKTFAELVKGLNTPRAILIMVEAGPAVDAVIAELLPSLQRDDILIDAGNSHYRDTERRAMELKERGIRFLGMGVSGGEEGALKGPSMMPGGDEEAYRALEPLLQKMAANDGAGGKCVAFMGPGGAGHFVKTVHNGIEYAVMQILAESYDILKNVGGFGNEALAETYEAWNAHPALTSFLLEITAKIFRTKDQESGGDLIDMIKDAAGQKGTGKWTTQAALDYGVAIPTINAAVDARILSGSEDLRARRKLLAEAIDTDVPVPAPEKLRSMVSLATELSTIQAYSQGFELIRRASDQDKWGIDAGAVARIWRGGCIIRSAMLSRFQNAYSSDPEKAEGARDAFLERFRGERQLDWRRTVSMATNYGHAIPAIASALAYYDGIRHERLPQCLIQAQRDFFGAHKYERIDREGTFHSEWE